LTSKIINMAERLKDKEDLALETLFRSDPVADDGFSVQVVSRIRRQVWIRRLSMPIAILVGGAISAGPVLEVLNVLPGLMSSLFGASLSFDRVPVESLPQVSTILMGAALVMAMLLGSKLLEE
jgi:hypothetical protein